MEEQQHDTQTDYFRKELSPENLLFSSLQIFNQ
jgi:hypothetical protein